MKSFASVLKGLVFLLAIVPFASEAEIRGTASDGKSVETLILPPLEVSGDFSADGWIYGRVGSMEVLSQLSIVKTRSIFDDFLVFQDFVRSKYPEAAPDQNHLITLVLFKSFSEYRVLSPKEEFAEKLSHSKRFLAIDESQQSDDKMRRNIRMLWMDLAYATRSQKKIPLWRELATKEILSAILITKGGLQIGFPPFMPDRQLPLMGVLSEQFRMLPGYMVPLERLFTLERPLDRDQNYAASMQATAFSHQCLFGAKDHRFRKPYEDFVKRLEREKYSEKLFHECFGISTTAMFSRHYDYVFNKSLKWETIRYKYSPTQPFELRGAKPSEVLALVREISSVNRSVDRDSR